MNDRREAQWRVFCAIEVPPPVRQLVLQHGAHLRRAVPEARASWSRDANLHLTLKFLGDIPKTSVADLSAAASRSVVGISPFSIRLERTGVFPRPAQARVLWIGINDLTGQLGELQQRLENEADSADFAKEVRSFQPHLTIARVRQPEAVRALAAAHLALAFAPVDIAVSELLVIRSELGSEGSKYTVVSRHGLVE